MGYYTYFQIGFKKTKKADEIKRKLEEISGYKFQEFEHKGNFELNSDDTIKWYRFDDDMTALSLEFPEVIFQVDGDGEDSDDVWRTYFLNGKSQSVEAKFVYGKLDLKKLKGEADG